MPDGEEDTGGSRFIPDVGGAAVPCSPVRRFE